MFFLAYLLFLLASKLSFCLINFVKIIVDLIVGFSINNIVSKIKKVIVGLLKYFLYKLIIFIRYYIIKASFKKPFFLENSSKKWNIDIFINALILTFLYKLRYFK